jgi:hypothetical protein
MHVNLNDIFVARMPQHALGMTLLGDISDTPFRRPRATQETVGSLTYQPTKKSRAL